MKLIATFDRVVPGTDEEGRRFSQLYRNKEGQIFLYTEEYCFCCGWEGWSDESELTLIAESEDDAIDEVI